MRVAWIGTGTMGAILAGRLQAAGHALTVYNRTAHKAEPLIAAGARAARTPREAVDGSEIVMSMVSDGVALRSLLDGADGILAGIGDGLLVDLSTLGARVARDIGHHVRGAGARFVDAPVVGGRRIAGRGELVIAAGGAPADVELARSVFAALAKHVVHAGDIGAGQAVKAALAGVQAAMAAALAEGVVACRADGATADAFLSALCHTHMACDLFRHKADRVRSEDWKPGVSIDRVAADLDHLVAEASTPVAVATAVRALLEHARASGLGHLDYAALASLLAGGSKP